MPTLECPGVFSLVLPDGWQVTGVPGKRYELTPSTSEDSLQISVYDRRAAPITEAEARDLMARFLNSLLPNEAVDMQVIVEDDTQCRAVARCSANDRQSGEQFAWLVFLVLWKTNCLMCTCTASPDSIMINEAELLFASIAPFDLAQRNVLRRRQN